MEHVDPQSLLDLEIDRAALDHVVGGEEGGKAGGEAKKGEGNTQWHMLEGIGVGVASYLIDRYERKNLALDAGIVLTKLGHLVR